MRVPEFVRLAVGGLYGKAIQTGVDLFNGFWIRLVGLMTVLGNNKEADVKRPAFRAGLFVVRADGRLDQDALRSTPWRSDSSSILLSTENASVCRARIPASCLSTLLPTTPVSVTWPFSTMIRTGGLAQLA